MRHSEWSQIRQAYTTSPVSASWTRSECSIRGAFYPYSPSMNLLAQDDESAGNNQFLLSSYLQTGTAYILVVTTYPERATGTFSITATGPGSLMFLRSNTTVQMSSPWYMNSTTPMYSSWSMYNSTSWPMYNSSSWYPGYSKSSDLCEQVPRFPL